MIITNVFIQLQFIFVNFFITFYEHDEQGFQ